MCEWPGALLEHAQMWGACERRLCCPAAKTCSDPEARGSGQCWLLETPIFGQLRPPALMALVGQNVMVVPGSEALTDQAEGHVSHGTLAQISELNR